jgi:signal transduction histidine kinase
MNNHVSFDDRSISPSRRRRGRLALQISISLTVILTSCVLVMSLTAKWFNSSKAEIKQQAIFHESKIWIQKVFSEPVKSLNKDLLVELANVMIKSPDNFVRELEVKNREGNRIVELEDGTLAEPGDVVEEFAIHHQGQVVGSVRMRARAQGVVEYFRGVQSYIWASAAMISIMIAIVSFLVLDRLLTRPLEELIYNLDKVERANYKINLQQSYAGELSTLAKAFQRAIGGIEQRDSQLLQYASNLEGLVDARTKERDRERMNSLNTAKLASIGEVSAGLAHEINNPLTVIQGTVSILEHQMFREQALETNQVESIRGHLEKISLMVQRINSIVKSLKYFARDGANDPKLEFSVNRMSQEVTSLVSMQMNQFRIDFKSEIPMEQIKLLGQEVQISQVIVNLLQNSIDAVKNQPTRSILLQLLREGSDCCIRVSDNGVGVSRDVVEKIFQPFFTTKTIGQGTGLGLSIAHGIVKQHDGEIHLINERQPTVFEVRLPIAVWA